MSNPKKNTLADLGKLMQGTATAALTDQKSVMFQFVFNYKLEDAYNFSSIDSVTDPNLHRQLYAKEKLKLIRLLHKCIDSFVNKSITEVDKEYLRKPDIDDTTIDPIDGNKFPIQHYSISLDSRYKARIHGYFKGGLFYVKRIDWCHQFHKSKKRK